MTPKTSYLIMSLVLKLGSAKSIKPVDTAWLRTLYRVLMEPFSPTVKQEPEKHLVWSEITRTNSGKVSFLEALIMSSLRFKPQKKKNT